MKIVLSLFFVLVGSLLIAAPMFFSFLLSVSGNRIGVVSMNDREACSAAGGVLLFVGIIFSIISFATSGRGKAKD